MERWPAATACVEGGREYTYADLEAASRRAAAWLHARNVRRGARVAILAGNTWSHIVLLLACLRSGVIACPLGPRLPADAVRRRLRELRVDLVVAEGGDLRVAGMPGAAVVDALPGEGSAGGAEAYVADTTAAQPATIIGTSGSAGAPKLIVHGLAAHYYSALGSNDNIPLRPGDRWLLSLPLHHVGGVGILFRCLLGGAAVVLAPPGRLDGPWLARARVSHVSLVATQLRRLLEAEAGPPPPGGLRCILAGGGPMPAILLQEALNRGLPVRMSYGLTEAASQVTAVPLHASARELQTSGKVLPHRDLRVEASGEILVRGRTMALGVWNGTAVEDLPEREGWYATGDLGHLDAGGFLTVTGRRDNMMISGGENIHPEVIEEALQTVCGALDAVVVPVPDDEYGQRPVAFVRTTGGPASHANLSARLRECLPSFMIPDAFFEMPEDGSATMKPDRLQWRRLAEQRVGRG